MSRISPIRPHFSTGEIAPTLYGRVDLELWYSGLELLENFIVLPQGGLRRRSGRRYVRETKHQDQKAIFIPFVFSVGQAYALEFGHEYIRFLFNEAVIEDPAQPGEPYEIVSPFTEDHLADIKFHKEMDVMYLAHPQVQPQKLSRLAHAEWTIAPVSFTDEPDDWETDNYPSALCLFKDRSWWMGCPKQPLKQWASRQYFYEILTTSGDTTETTDGFVRTISSPQANQIMWAVGADGLVMGSYGQVIVGGQIISTEGIGPENYAVRPHTTKGFNGIQGRLVGENILAWGKNSKRLYELAPDAISEKLKGNDLALRAEHLFKQYGVAGFEFVEDPYNLVYAWRTDGLLLGLTYYREESVVAWHQHPTQGEVESACVIPGAGRDVMYLMIKRTIDGQTRRFIEVEQSGEFSSIEDAFFVDAGITYTGEPKQTITDLNHLVGEEVAILADGAEHPTRTVDENGQVVLESAASKVHLGLAYTSRARTLPYGAGMDDGSSRGKLKSIHSVILHFVETVGGKVGPPGSLSEIPFRDRSDPMGQALEPYTGETEPITFDGGFDRKAQIEVAQDKPLPMTLVAIEPQMSIHDR